MHIKHTWDIFWRLLTNRFIFFTHFSFSDDTIPVIKITRVQGVHIYIGVAKTGCTPAHRPFSSYPKWFSIKVPQCISDHLDTAGTHSHQAHLKENVCTSIHVPFYVIFQMKYFKLHLKSFPILRGFEARAGSICL